MKTLYLDCSMGAAGDMLTSALLELLPDPSAFVSHFNSIGIPGVQFSTEKITKCGILGTHSSVLVNGVDEGSPVHNEDIFFHEKCSSHDGKCSPAHGESASSAHHQHRSLSDIEAIVRSLKISDSVMNSVLAVYKLIADAESHVHGVPVSEIHFHEVGTMDAISDITAVCMLMEELAPEQVVISPVNVGGGHVKCAHGILPLPAPAAAYLLQGIPSYSSGINGELCTPTGAALIRYFAISVGDFFQDTNVPKKHSKRHSIGNFSFGDMPLMSISSIGYGMGKKDFETANCVRAILGETPANDTTQVNAQDTISEFTCNIDDMTPEETGFAMERLFAEGALDVFSTPAYMKKSRPAILLHILCREEDRDQIIKAIFKYTTTIGIREAVCRRYILDRNITTVTTEYGDVRCKHSAGYGTTRSKYEYEDIAGIAREHGLSLSDVKKLLDESSKQ